MGRRKGSSKGGAGSLMGQMRGMAIKSKAEVVTEKVDEEEEVVEEKPGHTVPLQAKRRGPKRTLQKKVAVKVDDKNGDVEEMDLEDSELSPEKYQVEKIVETRVRESDGGLDYFLKWKDYPHEANSWEPSENVDCPELLAEYMEEVRVRDERKRLREEKKALFLLRERSGKMTGDEFDSSGSEDSDPDHVNNGISTSTTLVSAKQSQPPPIFEHGLDVERIESGFSRGFTPHKILGAVQEKKEGKTLFLMQWVGSSVSDLVPAKEANVRCPQLVIKFYENRMFWDDDPENDPEKKDQEKPSTSSASVNANANSNANSNGKNKETNNTTNVNEDYSDLDNNQMGFEKAFKK